MTKPIAALLLAAGCVVSGCASPSTQTVGPAHQKIPPRSGSTVVRVATDDKGNIASVEIVKSAGSAMLDANTIKYVKTNWHGPPNSTREVEFRYVLR